MAQVTVRINGYSYTVGCQDGEEDHLLSMAAEVDRRIDTIKSVAGQSGETRLLVMTALLMADDLFEMNRALKEAQKQADVAAKAASQAAQSASDPKLERRLTRLAKRAEEIAAGLEHP